MTLTRCASCGRVIVKGQGAWITPRPIPDRFFPEREVGGFFMDCPDLPPGHPDNAYNGHTYGDHEPEPLLVTYIKDIRHGR